MQYEKIDDYLNYFFMFLGLLLLLSLFITEPIVFIAKYFDFGKTSIGFFENLILGIVPILVLSLLYLLIPFAFMRKWVNSFLDFVGNFLTSALLFIVIAIVAVFLRMPLFQINSGLSFGVTFLGLFYTVSSYRYLKNK